MREKVLCRVLITFLWVLVLTIPAFAQTKTISGIISDQTGVLLLKATIKVKGEKISTVSDANGQFKLVVPERATELEVSYVDMKQSPYQHLTCGLPLHRLINLASG